MLLYFHLAYYRFLRFYEFPLEILANILRRMINILSLTILWHLVGQFGGHVQSLNQTASYFLIAFGVEELVMAKWGPFGKLLARSIKHGKLSNFLIRPVSTVPYLYLTALGQNGINYLIAVSCILAGIATFPSLSPVGLLFFLAILPASIILGFCYNLFLGCLFFYTTDATGIRNSIGHMSRILSGAWIPITLYPDSVKFWALNSPFQVMVYSPTKALQSASFSPSLLQSLEVAYFWAIVIFFIAMFFWSQSIKKYEAVGI